MRPAIVAIFAAHAGIDVSEPGERRSSGHAGKRGGRFRCTSQSSQASPAHARTHLRHAAQHQENSHEDRRPRPTSELSRIDDPRCTTRTRRREATDVIHRYRHLGSDRVEINLCDPTPSPDTKTHARQLLNKRRGKNVGRLSETQLMVLILLGFGVVHVIGGVLIARHPRKVNLPWSSQPGATDGAGDESCFIGCERSRGRRDSNHQRDFPDGRLGLPCRRGETRSAAGRSLRFRVRALADRWPGFERRTVLIVAVARTTNAAGAVR